MTLDTKTALIIGGTSDIAKATALILAGAEWSITLCGRDIDALDREARNIELRVPRAIVSTRHLDIFDTASFSQFIDALGICPSLVICAVGLLGQQSRAEIDPAHAETILRTNFEGPALLLGMFAEKMVTQGSGTIVGISSVAGDRGRAANYVYGAAKAGFTAFLSGLRNRLAEKGVHVITVKPGFVRTRMTDGMALPGPLTAEPEEVGRAILRAITRKHDVVYVRPIWRIIMTMICCQPEFIFKRLKL